MKVENGLRLSHSKSRKKHTIKFQVCDKLFILTEGEPNSGVRE